MAENIALVLIEKPEPETATIFVNGGEGPMFKGNPASDNSVNLRCGHCNRVLAESVSRELFGENVVLQCRCGACNYPFWTFHPEEPSDHPPEDLLEGAKLKVERAKTHIEEFKAEVVKFQASDPCIIFRKPDPGNRTDSIHMGFVKPVPKSISLIVGDAVHNLRTALDHCACAAALANGAQTITDVHFPFARSKEIFEATAGKKIKKLPVWAKDIIYGLKPYPGGNDLLYALHEADLIDKHRILMPTEHITKTTIKLVHLSYEGPVAPRPVFEPDWANKTIRVLEIDRRTTNLKYEFGLPATVAFDEVEGIKGQAVPTVFRQFVDLVERIIGLFSEKMPGTS